MFYLSYRYNLLYVIQTKVDSKGECYGRALQHILTGAYLSELCLIGLFSARKAPGPSTLVVILLLATILYHSMLTHILISLKKNFTSSEEGETVPLLADEEDTTENNESHSSRTKSVEIGLSRLPLSISVPLARILMSYVASGRDTMKSWMSDPSARESEDGVHYTENEIEDAYVNPAVISKTPKLWLVRDELGVSKKEIEMNEAVGISSTDSGAFLDSHNHVRWVQDDFSKVPIFKTPVKY